MGLGTALHQDSSALSPASFRAHHPCRFSNTDPGRWEKYPYPWSYRLTLGCTSSGEHEWLFQKKWWFWKIDVKSADCARESSCSICCADSHTFSSLLQCTNSSLPKIWVDAPLSNKISQNSLWEELSLAVKHSSSLSPKTVETLAERSSFWSIISTRYSNCLLTLFLLTNLFRNFSIFSTSRFLGNHSPLSFDIFQ